MPSPMPVVNLLLCLLCMEVTARVLFFLRAALSTDLTSYSELADIASNYFDKRILYPFFLTSVALGMNQVIRILGESGMMVMSSFYCSVGVGQKDN